MKILLYTKMFPRVGNESFGSYVYDQINEVRNLGNEVVVVSPHTFIPKIFSIFGGKLRKYALMKKEYIYNGIKVYSPKCLWTKELINNFPNIKYFIYKKSMKKFLIDICKSHKPDVLYSVDPILDGRLCVEVGNELGIPVYLIEHSVPANYRKFVNNKVAINIYKDVVKKATSTIFVSSNQKTLFEDIIDEKIKGKIIPNGYRYENDNINNLLPKKIDKSKVLKFVTVGFLEDRKGYPILFETIKRLNQLKKYKFELIIIGDGDDKKRYNTMIKDMGISDICHFKGLIPHSEVYRYLLDSDIFILPSIEESFGIVYLEAMSCGLPVIGTKGEGIEDIVQDMKNGYLIKRNDVNELLSTIVYIIENPDESLKVALNGMNTVKNLNWRTNAEEIVKVFKKIENKSEIYY